jgi:hypothetical protein
LESITTHFKNNTILLLNGLNAASMIGELKDKPYLELQLLTIVPKTDYLEGEETQDNYLPEFVNEIN